MSPTPSGVTCSVAKVGTATRAHRPPTQIAIRRIRTSLGMIGGSLAETELLAAGGRSMKSVSQAPWRLALRPQGSRALRQKGIRAAPSSNHLGAVLKYAEDRRW